MRRLNKIIIHCSDSKPRMDIGVKTIRSWHVDERGWSDIGYHYVIRKDGQIEIGRPLSRKGSHCRGENWDSIGICWVGGYGGVDDRTPDQKRALLMLIEILRSTIENPLKVHGHNEFNSHKTCPNFNVANEYS